IQFVGDDRNDEPPGELRDRIVQFGVSGYICRSDHGQCQSGSESDYGQPVRDLGATEWLKLHLNVPDRNSVPRFANGDWYVHSIRLGHRDDCADGSIDRDLRDGLLHDCASGNILYQWSLAPKFDPLRAGVSVRLERRASLRQAQGRLSPVSPQSDASRAHGTRLLFSADHGFCGGEIVEAVVGTNDDHVVIRGIVFHQWRRGSGLGHGHAKIVIFRLRIRQLSHWLDKLPVAAIERIFGSLDRGERVAGAEANVNLPSLDMLFLDSLLLDNLLFDYRRQVLDQRRSAIDLEARADTFGVERFSGRM